MAAYIIWIVFDFVQLKKRERDARNSNELMTISHTTFDILFGFNCGFEFQYTLKCSNNSILMSIVHVATNTLMQNREFL